MRGFAIHGVRGAAAMGPKLSTWVACEPGVLRRRLDKSYGDKFDIMRRAYIRKPSDSILALDRALAKTLPFFSHASYGGGEQNKPSIS